jgi:hypothetical protein
MDDLTRAQLEALVSEATPGPWVADGDEVHPECGGVVAICYNDGAVTDGVDRTEPDARLIAAAPALARQLLATMDRAERAERALEEIVRLSADPVPPFETTAVTLRRKGINQVARAALNKQEPTHD